MRNKFEFDLKLRERLINSMKCPESTIPYHK